MLALTRNKNSYRKNCQLDCDEYEQLEHQWAYLLHPPH